MVIGVARAVVCGQDIFMIKIVAAALLVLTAFHARAECGVDQPCFAGEGEYLVALPSAKPQKAVIFLHGYGGTAKGTIRQEKVVGALRARGYAVIAPQGVPFGGNRAGGRWNTRGAAEARDDVAFINAVADDAAARFGLKRDEIMLAGFSGGGMMTWRVACFAPESFTAYAPVAGLLWRPLPEDCVGPVAMLHTHGWSDPVVPIEGRSVAGGRITQGDLFEGLAMMRRALGCRKDDPDEYGKTGIYLTRRWTDCADGAALEMALHPGGHMTPDSWADLALDWLEAPDHRPVEK